MKTRLFRTVVAFLFAGLALTQVGCYDSQIEDLNNRIDELTTGKIASIESQYSSLQTTLASLKSASDAVASENAALKTAISNLEGKLAGFLTQSQLDATLATYATLDDLAKLGNFTTEEAIQKAIDEAVKAGGEALEATFQTTLDAAMAAAAAENNKALQEQIAAALATAQENTAAAIAAACAEGGVISNAIAEKLAGINNELAKHISARLTSIQLIPELFVQGVETVELQSYKYNAITLEAVKDKAGVVTGEAIKKAATESTTTALATAVNYYVSPAQVTNEDVVLDKIQFVCHPAETRATDAEAVAVPVEVASASIKAGKLTVNLAKTASNAAINLGREKAWVGAVRVPIAEKHLTEGEADATVTSDYVALAESSVQPFIASVIDLNVHKGCNKQDCKDATAAEYDCTANVHNHFSATWEEAVAANASQKAVFDGEINLTEMVTGCADNKEVKPETLKAAGLEFRFSLLGEGIYTEGKNGADQQMFITEPYEKEGAVYVKAKLPNGVEDNEAIIGKTPIVRVTLVDVNNVDVNNKDAIVDVRYFKVEWTAYEAVPEHEKPILKLDVTQKFTYTLNCNDFEGKVTWKTMINEVLAKMNDGKGISFSDFVDAYVGGVINVDELVIDEKVVKFVNTGEVNLNNDNENDPEAPALVWTATAKEIGTVMSVNGELLPDAAKKTVTVLFEAKDKFKHNSYYCTFEMNVVLPYMPQMYGYRSALWQVDGVLANVYPVQYESSMAAGTTCVYNYDFDQLFTNSKLVKGMLPCGKWDIQWAATNSQPAAIKGVYGPFHNDGIASKEPFTGKSRDKRAYILRKLTGVTVEDAVVMTVDGNVEKQAWYSPDDTGVAKASEITLELKEVETTDNAGNTVLVPTEAAKGILGKNAVMKVWAQINPYNFYEVSKIECHFVEPLKINEKLLNAYFEDKVIDGSKIDCSKAFALTDFVDYLVAETEPANATDKQKYADELWSYYGVKGTEWDLDAAVVNIVLIGGNEVVDDTLTAETAKMKAEDYFGEDCLTKAGSILTFKNIRGVDVAKKVTVYVPVTVEHKWGKVSANVAVEIYPAGETPANN